MNSGNGDNPRHMLRSQRNAAAVAVPEFGPDDHAQMKEHLRPGLKDFCDGLLEGVAARERTAMNLYPRIMGAIGAEREVNINVATTQAFGMPADQVREIIEAHRRSGATTLDECQRDGVALCRWVIEQDETRRAEIMKAVGGTNALALAEGGGNGDG